MTAAPPDAAPDAPGHLLSAGASWGSEPATCVMERPWEVEVSAGRRTLRVDCRPGDVDAWAAHLVDATTDALDALAGSAVRVGMVGDAAVAWGALARPVRALVGAVEARVHCRRVLAATGVELSAPSVVPMPPPPSTSADLEDLLGCSYRLSRSLFVLGTADAVTDDPPGWHELGARLVGGRPPRHGRLDTARRALLRAGAMAALRGGVAVPVDHFGDAGPVRGVVRSRGRLRPSPEAREPREAVAPDPGLRAALTRDLPAPLAVAAAHLLPRTLVEGFADGERRARRYLRLGRPTAIVRPSHNDANAIWVAAARAAGTTVLGVQHGGGYGELADHPRGDSERLRVDRFVTWGWDDPGGGRLAPCAPLPSRRLGALARRAAGDGAVEARGVLLMFQLVAFDRAELAPTSVGPAAIGARHEALLDALDPAVRAAVRIRVRPPRFAHEAAFLRSCLGPLGRALPEDERPVHTMLGAAELVVVPRLYSTTFLECLALDTPVLVVDETFPVGMHPRVVGLYRRLADAGVLFTDPAAAGTAVNHVMAAGARAWWSSRRPVLDEARALLARTATDEGPQWDAAVAAT